MTSSTPSTTTHIPIGHAAPGHVATLKESFVRLDRVFFMSWLFDALFYVSVGVVVILSYFLFGSISEAITALTHEEATQAVVDAIYQLSYSFFAVIVFLFLIIIALYGLFNYVLWSTILTKHIDRRSVLRYLLYTLVVVFLIGIPVGVLVFVFVGLYALAIKSGFDTWLIGAFITWLLYACLLPTVVIPGYAFFREKGVFASLGRLFYVGFLSIPKLWFAYLAGGLVLLLVTQLYRVVPGTSTGVGSFVLLVLLLSPVLAWFRLYAVRVLQQHGL